jgi:dihydrofolate reductase
MKVILIMALTADGVISRSSDEFVDWTGGADKKMFMQLTKQAGVLIMGSKTYDTIGRPLPDRKNIVLTRNKERISTHPDLIYTDDQPDKLLGDLEQQGYTSVAIAGGGQINALFAAANRIDEMLLTIAPCAFGSGLRLFNSPLDMKLELLSHEVLEGKYMLLRYKVIK